ncbi:MAG: hypothetical protein K1X67_01260 [Fimbriimonadaceae bacterium]|nr:hypothetical protein [Fimbriimonadaceae bacterium]
MVLATILAALVLSSPEQAQTKYVYPKPMFDTFFPQPTGKNGFEDYIRASDMLLNEPAQGLLDALFAARRNHKLSPTSPYARQSYLTLCKKSLDMLGDIFVAIETGNKKVVIDPRTKLIVDMELPERQWFYHVVNTLGDLAYARYSRGESKVGTNILCQGLLFVRNTSGPLPFMRTQPTELSKYLFERLDGHLGQLSREDARLIVDCANDLLAQPPIARSMFDVERQLFVDFLGALSRRDFDLIGRYWFDGEAGSFREEVLFVKDAIGKLSQADLDRLVQRMAQTGEKWFADASAALAKAESDWTIVGMQSPDPLENRLCHHWSNYSWAPSAREQTQLRLMRLHGLIIAYRWENNQLPVDLEALNAPEAIVDPLAKTQFVYKPTPAGTYELYSRGGNAYGRIDLKYVKGA